jgi:hypothetical protein
MVICGRTTMNVYGLAEAGTGAAWVHREEVGFETEIWPGVAAAAG